MYLDDILTDRFWFIVTLLIAIVFLYLGRRNYRGVDKSPFTPLGKYMLYLYRKQRVLDGVKEEQQVRLRIVRLEALLAIIAGISMLVIMLLTVVILSLM